MAKTLTALESELQIRIRDKTSGIVEDSDMLSFFNLAIDRLKVMSEFPGTKMTSDMEVFEGVYEYPVPTGYKTAIDFRVNNFSKEFSKRLSSEFWRDVQYNTEIYADDNAREARILLLSSATGKGYLNLNESNSLTANGTWAVVAGTDAVNLTLDTAEYATNGASLNFDIDVTGSVNDFAAIDNSTMTQIDLTDHEDKSTIFIDVFTPDETNITSYTLVWGSDSSNYWTQTVTTQFSGVEIKDGWKKYGFAWNGATKTGSPDVTKIDYVKFQVNYSASQVSDTDFRIGSIVSKLPERLTVGYYSTDFVKDSSGNYTSSFTSGDDVSILESHEDSILLFLALEEAFLFLRQVDDAEGAYAKAEDLIQGLHSDKPNEDQKTTSSYILLG